MHLNLIWLFVFAACVLAGTLAIRFYDGNRVKEACCGKPSCRVQSPDGRKSPGALW